MSANQRRMIVLLVSCALFSTAGCGQIESLVSMGAGSKAKFLCSNMFISNRSAQSILEEEASLAGRGLGSLGELGDLLTRCEVDLGEESVTCSLLGSRRKAVYREYLGCTLLFGSSREDIVASEAEVTNQATGDLTPYPPGQELLPWPTGDALTGEIPPEVDQEALESALDEAFSEPDPENPRRTRAVVVVYDGKLITERYAEDAGYSMLTPHYGWSMTKSVASVLIGILAGQGALDIDEPAPVPEWSDPGDPRSAITTDQLLRMSSGLTFDEDYGSIQSDVNIMLFDNIVSMAAYAAGKPLASAPDTAWHYSTGTSTVVGRIMRDRFESLADSFAFSRRELFDRVGMRSAIIEPDQAGNLSTGAYMWATPRDWARFGLLCLQDGLWEGERVIPEGWMAYATTPTPTDPWGEYGAQFWLNVGSKEEDRYRPYPNLPTDLFECAGHDSQMVTMIPSRNLVVVRVGYTPDESAWDHEAFMLGIMDAIGE